MKILVINTGSSSIKYQLFDMANETVLATGMAERIGSDAGTLSHTAVAEDGTCNTIEISEKYLDHARGLACIADLLMDENHGVITDTSDIFAVGHRVVHGGETFQDPRIIEQSVIDEIEKNTPLAPLHNPANLTGIRVAGSVFPNVPQVAVFDTAFHQTLPKQAYMYALPHDLYDTHQVRRYGFHGTSHACVAGKAADFLNIPLERLNLITLHLGNGASATAIHNGKSVDTSMGLTPLEGLVMGTRSGDVDPAIPFFLSRHLNMSLDEIDAIFNRQSGLKGLCGENDMRTVLAKAAAGDDRARLALEVYTYRIKKYIGAYFAVLGRVDALVFTGGIGENAPAVREHCCRGLSCLGIEIDPVTNKDNAALPRRISPSKTPVAILVVPTDEELEIARQTRKKIFG
ncbi:MAG: acetate kinase [Desulfotignum sp.]|nr:acetate kinase [Desulfotignum sp.]